MFLSNQKINWTKVAVAGVVTVCLVLAGIFGFDKWLFNILRACDCSFFRILGKIFNAKAWLCVSFIAVCIFYIRKMIVSKSKFSLRGIYDKIKGSYAFWIFCSVCVALATCGVLKVLLGRARPIFYEALNMTGFYPFARDWAFHSMPSGHTVASFAGLVMIGLIAPRAKWFTWTLATVIGVSRVCVGAHWPSDVILGAFIGMVCADAVMAFFARRVNK